MVNSCGTGEGLSHEDKLHVVCSVMGISSEVLLQRAVDRYYSMLVKHAGTFEDAMPSVAGDKNGDLPSGNIPSPVLETSTSAGVAAAEQLLSRSTIAPNPTSTDNSPSLTPAVNASPSMLANGAPPTAEEKRTRRWASLPTEELDKMIVAALQKKGACNLRELTISTGYTSTNRLLQRACALEKQGMLEVVKKGRGYLINIADRQLQ